MYRDSRNTSEANSVKSREFGARRRFSDGYFFHAPLDDRCQHVDGQILFEGCEKNVSHQHPVRLMFYTVLS